MKMKYLNRIAVIFITAASVSVLGGCGGSTDGSAPNVPAESSVSENEEESVSQTEAAPADAENGSTDEKNYFHIGDTIEFANDVSFTLVQAGKSSDGIDTYVYLEVEIDNESGEEYQVSLSDITFYGDDYALETVYTGDEDIVDKVTGNGRKAKGYFYAKCPNYDYTTDIQAELGDAIIIIKSEDTETVPLYDMQESEKDYIIPDSSTRYLSDDDLVGLSKEELKLARNEIFARHGRIFNDPDLQSYFEAQPWYTGTISADDFSDDMLSDIERDNIALIRSYEEQ